MPVLLPAAVAAMGRSVAALVLSIPTSGLVPSVRERLRIAAHNRSVPRSLEVVG